MLFAHTETYYSTIGWFMLALTATVVFAFTTEKVKSFVLGRRTLGLSAVCVWVGVPFFVRPGWVQSIAWLVGFGLAVFTIAYEERHLFVNEPPLPDGVALTDEGGTMMWVRSDGSGPLIENDPSWTPRELVAALNTALADKP